MEVETDLAILTPFIVLSDKDEITGQMVYQDSITNRTILPLRGSKS